MTPIPQVLVVRIEARINDTKSILEHQGLTSPLKVVVTGEDIPPQRAILKLARPDLQSIHPLHHKNTETFLARELICNVLLTKLGCNPPRAFLAYVDPKSVSHICKTTPDLIPLVNRNGGFHFATEYLENFDDLPPRTTITEPRLLQHCQRIFTADHLIYNLDRGVNKPNLLYNSREVVPIDHGLAFEALDWDQNATHTNYNHQGHALFQSILRYAKTQKLEHLTTPVENWQAAVPIDLLLDLHNFVKSVWDVSQESLSNTLAYLSSHAKVIDALCSRLKSCFPENQ